MSAHKTITVLALLAVAALAFIVYRLDARVVALERYNAAIEAGASEMLRRLKGQP